MQFDPSILLDRPLAVAGLLLVILVGGSVAALAVAGAGRLGRAAAARLAASLSQAGEFSFILAAFGLSFGLIGAESRDLIIAAALLSIALNPFLFRLADRLQPARPPKT
jgi:CPA2 family monovalent cation:H+ antiporter-2